MISKEHFCAFPQQKANHFLNKSTIENPLPQELSRNKEFLKKFFKDFSIKCMNIRNFEVLLKA